MDDRADRQFQHAIFSISPRQSDEKIAEKLNENDRSKYDDEVPPGIAAFDEQRYANDVKSSFHPEEK